MRKRKADKSILLLGAIILIVLASLLFAWFQLRTDAFSEQLKKGNVLAFLFTFSGDKDYRFFEVFLYHPQTRKGAITFIPGNVGSIIESLKRVDRIDVLYNHADLGPLRTKIEQLTGVKIPFVVDIREGELSRLVDLLGGLELFIPNPVDFISGSAGGGTGDGAVGAAGGTNSGSGGVAGGAQGAAGGDRRILLPSGSVNLDGDKLADFISFGDPLEPEMDRVGRRQKFLQALLREMGAKSEFLLSESPYRVLRRNMATNLNGRALAAFIREMRKFEAERVIFQRVLGSERTVDGKPLIFPHFEGDLLKDTMKQTLATIASSEVAREDPLSVSVQILNGTDVAGLARRAANVFQSFGYDVALVNNADKTDYARTVIIDRKGLPGLAQKVAELIHCERVVTQLDPAADLSVDITVILGKDFDGRYCKK